MNELKILTPEQLTQATVIENRRLRASSNDSPELQEKKMKFLSKLVCSNLKIIQTYEMYPYENDLGSISSKPQIPQYLHEIEYHNSRTQICSELRAETDKLDFKKTIEFICEICLELIKKRIHFSVFYADGQKSPHIIIYDFEELSELNPYQRTKARAKFWRWIIPFRVHLLDNAIWNDDQLVPIEFGLHWKYQTPFRLIFEYIPKEEKNAAVTN